MRTRERAKQEGKRVLSLMTTIGWKVKTIRRSDGAFSFRLQCDPFRIYRNVAGKFYCTINGTSAGYTSDEFEDPNHAFNSAMDFLDRYTRMIDRIRKSAPKASGQI